MRDEGRAVHLSVRQTTIRTLSVVVEMCGRDELGGGTRTIVGTGTPGRRPPPLRFEWNPVAVGGAGASVSVVPMLVHPTPRTK